MKLGEHLCGRVAEDGVPILLERLHESEHARSALGAMGMRCYAGFPLSVGGRTLGTVCFASHACERFGEGAVQLMQAVCDQVAVRLARDNADRGMRDTDDRLRVALRAARLGVFEWDVEGDVARWENERMFEIVGRERERGPFTRAELYESLLPEDRPMFDQELQRAMESNDLFTLSYRIRRPDDAIRWIDLSGCFQAAAGDRPRRLVGVMKDVTERKFAEDALRTSEARFREMANQMPVIVWLLDGRGRLEFVNDAWCAYFGKRREDAPDFDWREVIHPDDVAGSTHQMREALTHRRPFESRRRVRRADGEWRWLSSTGRPHHDYDADGTDQLLASEREQEAARQKDDFIAMLAHELRNPLAPIRTAVAVMHARGADEAALGKCRGIIDRQVEHMARLLDELLDVSRLSRGKLSLQRQRVRLRDVLESAVETARPAMDKKRHLLRVERIDERVILDADAARMTQVFSNLLNNAAKYTNPGGEISVSTRGERDAVVVLVRDTGIGIPPEMRGRVFDLFTQVHGGQHRAEGGLGIGLALSKRLVEMHGGAIAVESANPGSVFSVRLPLAEGSAEPIFHESRLEPGKQRRVLVVDDNRDAADTMAMLLETIDCEVRVVYSGAAALQVARDFRPDLVLLDLGMPELDGPSVCAKLRAESWGAGIVIAAVTGWGQEEDRRRTKASGFDHHLVKPIKITELAALVHGTT